MSGVRNTRHPHWCYPFGRYGTVLKQWILETIALHWSIQIWIEFPNQSECSILLQADWLFFAREAHQIKGPGEVLVVEMTRGFRATRSASRSECACPIQRF